MTTPVVVTAADMKSAARKTIRVVNTHNNNKTEVYEGVPLAELLAKAGLPQGANSGAAHGYLRPGRSRGWVSRRVLSRGTRFSFLDSDVLVEDRMDGAPIGGDEGPYKMVAPHDKRPGRWVRIVKSITVIRVSVSSKANAGGYAKKCRTAKSTQAGMPVLLEGKCRRRGLVGHDDVEELNEKNLCFLQEDKILARGYARNRRTAKSTQAGMPVLLEAKCRRRELVARDDVEELNEKNLCFLQEDRISGRGYGKNSVRQKHAGRNACATGGQMRAPRIGGAAFFRHSPAPQTSGISVTIHSLFMLDVWQFVVGIPRVNQSNTLTFLDDPARTGV